MHTLGRVPRDRELAEKAGIDVDTLWRWQADIERTVQVSLDATDGDHDEEGQTPLAYLRANIVPADEQLLHAERIGALRAALGSLKPQQRTVLMLYYFEELNARQIAQVLAISESRVSQIRSRALAALRDRLSPVRQTA